MKMIGMCADLVRLRISAAVSRPSSPGMLTSSRMTAKSRCRTCRSASSPELAAYRFCSSSSRIARKTTCLSGRSSTTRMFALPTSLTRCVSFDRWRLLCASFPTTGVTGSARQPGAQHADHQLGIDRLRQVIPRAGFHAFLAVALHRFGGDGDDREVAAGGNLADLPDRVDPVELG